MMQVLDDPAALQAAALAWKRAGLRLGLVPTMGALHAGHLSLVALARPRVDRLVVSLFVNPAQFGPHEDLARYPRDLEGDLARCREAGVDLVFAPADDAMYAPDRSVWVEETQLSRGLCGAHRPGHFRGVATVVAKLFNLAQPDVAVFGAKDYQQLCVIRRMVRDLDMPVEIVAGPIQRDPDGLALSSRNAALSPEERAQALALPHGLTAAAERVTAGERDAAALEAQLRVGLEGAGLRVDYAVAVDASSLAARPRLAGRVLIAAAVHCGRTRLIDNVVVTAGEAGQA